ncbi:MAG: GNAT family N-acetyltransferase [Cyclobacteriaceae bacterium]|nr:MAG: GNAT family N-acetyltransferase [Cyclobacteriaceae bacterium]
MNDLIIRQATPSDKPTLLHFEQGVIEAERPCDPTLKLDETLYYDLDEMIRAPHIELLVAEMNGKLAACGYARIESSKHYLQHRQHAYLGFMYVTPEHRGKGINQKIMEALKDWAVGQGVHELRLEVYVQNESAIRAYEKIGFVRHMYEMRKSAL